MSKRKHPRRSSQWSALLRQAERNSHLTLEAQTPYLKIEIGKHNSHSNTPSTTHVFPSKIHGGGGGGGGWGAFLLAELMRLRCAEKVDEFHRSIHNLITVILLQGWSTGQSGGWSGLIPLCCTVSFMAGHKSSALVCVVRAESSIKPWSAHPLLQFFLVAERGICFICSLSSSISFPAGRVP